MRPYPADDEVGGVASWPMIGGQNLRFPVPGPRALALRPGPAHFGIGETALALGDRGLALEEYGLLKGLDGDLAGPLFRRIDRWRPRPRLTPRPSRSTT